MEGYDLDEYEDMDEYEEEDEEVGEEEEEEARLPTQEELEYLELRQNLKETIRKQMKKDSGSALSNSREKKNRLPYDNFGSFFGPSQPVIAPRVIQESKSLLENPHLAARVSKAHNSKNKGYASTPVGSKPQANDQPSEVKSRLKPKSKIQMLKNTRDYSFLLSDDAEFPAPSKNPPQSVSAPKSEAQSAQRTVSNTGRKVLNGREERKPMPTVSQARVKAGLQKPSFASKPNSTSLDSRKQLGSNNGSGPGRPSGPGQPSGSGRPSGSRRPSGPDRHSGPKSVPSKIPIASKEKLISASGGKSSVPGVRKPLPLKSLSSVRKQPLEQKTEYRESTKGKMMTKQPVLSSKPQVKQQPAKFSTPGPFQKDRPKKRPVPQRSDDEDDCGAISMIRQMFGYNPNRFRDEDDDSDMEANFDDIMKEERRSAKIARKEDEEELRKIEEEERRERMRKKQKLGR